jgi:hypothetical protein
MSLCLTCNNTNDFRTLNSASSRCVPIAGFYESTITPAAPCPTCCATCLSNTQCTSCSAGCFLNLNLSCLTSCPDRSYKNTQNLRCSNCPLDCLTCDSSQNCLSCSPSDFRELSSNRCMPMKGYFNTSKQIAAKCPAICASC